MKIAWFTDLEYESLSAYFLEQLLPFLTNDHCLQIFSSKKTEFLNHEVKNYLVFEQNQYDICVFVLEDRLSSTFVYDLSAVIPGIRIFIDNQFNDLKFNRIAHITNGIVYDQLLKDEGYDSTISISSYHMRGWSLEPYKSLYPFYYQDQGIGVNILTNRSYRNFSTVVGYLNFPLRFKPRQRSLSELKIYNIQKLKIAEEISTLSLEDATLGVYLHTNNQKSLPMCVIRALEQGLPFIFIANSDFYNQLSLRPGINQFEVLRLLLKKINLTILNLLQNNINNYALENSAENVYKQLMSICKQNINLLLQQKKDSSVLALSTQLGLINSINNFPVDILTNFSNRFSLSE